MKLGKSVRNLGTIGAFVGGAILVYFLIQYGFQGFTEVLKNVKPQLDRQVAVNQAFDRPGSPEAAIGLAGEYAMHSFIVVGDPRIKADTAAVPILVAGRKCELTMQRAKVDAENRTGWRVTNQSCQ